ncbi:MAG: DUF1572 domain-containing protein [Pirellulales bacterium]|nr:DUF1572 domain-containing protein [Pirellulales bacterium]
MPIEATTGDELSPSKTELGPAVLAESQRTLAHALAKIEHCLTQLTDEDVWWRPQPTHNSIQNIVLHLCGNVRQWIVHGIGGAPDVRNRPLEFSDREPRPKHELVAQLRGTVAEANAALATFPAGRLPERCRIQGFETTRLAAIFETVSHFVGHTHQIVYITRMRLGDRYRFQFVPKGKEQGGE